MKKSNAIVVILSVSLMTLLGGSSVVSASDVTSLRGGHDINMVSNIPNRRNRIKDTDPYERTWKEQPPIMPHKDYGITIKENRCMECHSDENYKEEEATQIGRSHYVDRSGASINHLAGNRYFCNQCHAPQFRLDPLVGNLFSTSTRR